MATFGDVLKVVEKVEDTRPFIKEHDSFSIALRARLKQIISALGSENSKTIKDAVDLPVTLHLGERSEKLFSELKVWLIKFDPNLSF
jgi:hypothetical protein